MAQEYIIGRLRRLLHDIESRDQQLAKELQSKRGQAAVQQESLKFADLATITDTLNESLSTEGLTEAVILRVGRPVLTVFRNETQLIFSEPESEIWYERLIRSKEALSSVIPSVGRIEVLNHPVLDWAGTGWLIAKDIIVTNRHVAELFGRSNGCGFVFRQSPTGSKMGSAIDLLQEDNNQQKWLFKITDILHIEPEPGPDLAFLLVDQSQGNTPTPLVLADTALSVETNVAVIGYPAKDSRMPDVDLMERIFGNVYNKKRLAPGQVTAVRPDKILHDCSTLGGCSGSAVVDLNSGLVAGLHFAGRFMDTNYAVPALLVAQTLDKVRKGTVQRPKQSTGGNVISHGNSGRETSILQSNKQPSSLSASVQGNQFTITIPLQISISVGTPTTQPLDIPQTQTAVASTPVKSVDEIENDELIT